MVFGGWRSPSAADDDREGGGQSVYSNVRHEAGAPPSLPSLPGASHVDYLLIDTDGRLTAPPTEPSWSAVFPSSSFLAPRQPAHAIARPGLVRDLERASRRQLTFVLGPSGSGKSVLLSQWALTHGEDVVWIHVEPETGASGLAHGLVHALDTVHPHVSDGLEELVDPHGSGLGRRFLLAVADAATNLPPTILAIDDLDSLVLPELATDLVALAEVLPPQIRLVLAARRRPVAALHRLMARGELSVIRPESLAFDDEETAAAVALVVGHEVKSAIVAMLHDRTGGWPIAVTMAAFALRSSPDHSAFLDRCRNTQDDLADHLTREVLAFLPEPEGRLLAGVALLDRVDAGLAEFALELTGASYLLERLVARTGVVVELDTDRRWYRVHDVVKDVLRRSDSSHGARQRQVLLRAARWHQERGELTDAARYLQRAAAWPELVLLLQLEGRRLAANGNGALLARWATSVSVRHLLAHPEDGAPVIEAMARGGLVEEATRLSRTLGEIDAAPEWLATVDIVLSLVSGELLHDPDAVLTTCDRLEAIAAGAPDAAVPPANMVEPLDRRGLAAVAELWRGRAHQQRGAYQASLAAFRAARQPGEHAGPALVDLLAMFGEATTLAWMGRLHAAEHLVEQLDLLAHDEPRGLPAELGVARAIIALARGDADAVQAVLGQIDLRIQAPWLKLWTLWDAVLRAEAALLVGDLDHAAALLSWDDPDPLLTGFAFPAARSTDHAVVPPPLLADQRLALLARVHLARGHHSAARLALRAGPRLVAGRLASVVLALGAGDVADARRVLAELDHVEHRHRLERDALEALVAELAGDEATARRILLETAEHAAIEGDLRPFLLPRQLATPLLRRSAPADATGILTTALDALGARRPAGRARPLHSVVASLSPRELEVLPLLPTHLTVSDIAERLYISTNTAKTHLRHIYRKLAVGNRRAAVTRATELGLLDGWR